MQCKTGAKAAILKRKDLDPTRRTVPIPLSLLVVLVVITAYIDLWHLLI